MVGWPMFLWITDLGILPITVASVVPGDRLLALPWSGWLAAGIGITGL